MKTKIVCFALAAVLAAGSIYSCNKGYNTTTGAVVNGTMGTGAMASVAIQDMAFMPQTLNIKTGTTVTWSNMDSMNTYTVEEINGQFYSGNIMPGQTFQYTFMNAGTFTYRSSMGNIMTNGMVVVTN